MTQATQSVSFSDAEKEKKGLKHSSGKGRTGMGTPLSALL